jgi:Tc toxin complex TcA C-terminal TcB-binding domain
LADSHFFTNYAATQSIATSTAQNDSGMFEVNFRDERYLPFEGAGLISSWRLDMPLDCNAFDFDTITDVVMNVRYTARSGGDKLRDVARAAALLPPRPTQPPAGSLGSFPSQNNLQRLFSLKHDPTEWYKFLNPADTATSQSMTITLDPTRFPYQYRNKTIKIATAELVMRFKSADLLKAYSNNPFPLGLGPAGLSKPISLDKTGYGKAQPAPPLPTPPQPRSWALSVDGAVAGADYNHLNPEAIEDILLLCDYGVS